MCISLFMFPFFACSKHHYTFYYILPWYQQGISPLPCHIPTSWFFGPVLCTSISWSTDVLATLYLHSLVSCTARRLRLEKNKIGTNITNFTTIWTPRSYVYNGELTLFLAARILFNLYKLSVTYCDLISKGMNISLYCIILTLSGTHTHTHTLNLKIEALCFSTMLVSVSKTTLSYSTEHHL